MKTSLRSDSLMFMGWSKDNNPTGAGYTELSEGDSGNPWWTKTGKNPVLVAIQSDTQRVKESVTRKFGYTDKESDSCQQFATKIQEKLVQFIKEKNEELSNHIKVLRLLNVKRCKAGTFEQSVFHVNQYEFIPLCEPPGCLCTQVCS